MYKVTDHEGDSETYATIDELRSDLEDTAVGTYMSDVLAWATSYDKNPFHIMNGRDEEVWTKE